MIGEAKIKVKIINSYYCGTVQAYEDAINQFICEHEITDIKVTQSNVSHTSYLLYKEVKNENNK